MARLSTAGVLLALLLAGCNQPPPDDLPLTELVVAPGCDVQTGCRAGQGDTRVDVRFGTTPHALQPFPVMLNVVSDVTVEAVIVRFYMPGMDMGMNRYQLQGDGSSGWRGAVTLPVCVSGRSDWVAEFEVLTGQQRLRFRLPFVLHK